MAYCSAACWCGDGCIHQEGHAGGCDCRAHANRHPSDRCIYCQGQGFHGDVHTGGESYCRCPAGQSLQHRESGESVIVGKPIQRPVAKPRPTAWDRLKRPSF